LMIGAITPVGAAPAGRWREEAAGPRRLGPWEVLRCRIPR
jgi:hypothetical protein